VEQSTAILGITEVQEAFPNMRSEFPWDASTQHLTHVLPNPHCLYSFSRFTELHLGRESDQRVHSCRICSWAGMGHLWTASESQLRYKRRDGEGNIFGKPPCFNSRTSLAWPFGDTHFKNQELQTWCGLATRLGCTTNRCIFKGCYDHGIHQYIATLMGVMWLG